MPSSGLCGERVRLPVPARDLRPDVRAGHARHAVLYRVPEADRAALRRRRRRRGRAREGRGPAGLRRPRGAGRAGGRAGARAARGRGLDRVAPARATQTGDLEGDVHRDRGDRRHRRQHPRLRRRRAAGDARQRRRRARRCATSSCRRSCAPARWRSRSPPPALRRRWPSASRREIADAYGEPYARLAVLLNEVRGWAKGTLPTYQDRKAFFEGDRQRRARPDRAAARGRRAPPCAS